MVSSICELLFFSTVDNYDMDKYPGALLTFSLLLIIIRLTHANVWESMGKPCSCMQFIKSRIFYCKSCENPYQYYKSRENPYQVLQVTHAVSERAMKSKVRMIK